MNRYLPLVNNLQAATLAASAAIYGRVSTGGYSWIRTTSGPYGSPTCGFQRPTHCVVGDHPLSEGALWWAVEGKGQHWPDAVLGACEAHKPGWADAEAARARMVAAEEALKAALPDGEKYHAYLLRSSVAYDADQARRGLPSSANECRGSAVASSRTQILRLGVQPGHPVGLVTFHRRPGAASVQGFFPVACGGPLRGDFVGGSVDGDIPHAVRTGDMSRRTPEDMTPLLARRGWRVVNRDEAITAAEEAGYALCRDRSHFHDLYPDESGPDAWRQTDEWTWAAFAVRA